jgi:excisionase family DNA binding protein
MMKDQADYTLQEAAARLHVSPRTVSRYVERGQLPYRDAAPLGSRHRLLRVPRVSVENLIEYRSHGGSVPTS